MEGETKVARLGIKPRTCGSQVRHAKRLHFATQLAFLRHVDFPKLELPDAVQKEGKQNAFMANKGSLITPINLELWNTKQMDCDFHLFNILK